MMVELKRMSRQRYEFSRLFKDWLLDNSDGSELLDYILNYGLKPDFKKLEEEIRKTHGR